MENRDTRIARCVIDHIKALGPLAFLEGSDESRSDLDIIDSAVEEIFPDATARMQYSIVFRMSAHPMVVYALAEAKQHARDWASDQAAWAKGPMSYYGLKEADFR